MRQSRGLTQAAFAKMCGITAGKMWKIENGRVNAALATLLRISSQLDAKPAELLKGIH
jgi:transcriptional regulator with XRE-family HTH domain